MMMTDAGRIGTNLHLLLLRRASDSFPGAFSAVGANTVEVGSLERGVDLKRHRAFPARRGRLGAVDGSGGTAGIAGITRDVDQRLRGRSQVGFGAFGGDVGDSTGTREDGMGVFVVLLTEGGQGDFAGHDI